MNLCTCCGVEVEADTPCCPLCGTGLQPGAQDERPVQAAPAPVQQEARRSVRRWLLEVVSLLAAMGAIAVLAADFASGMSLAWAPYPLASIGFVWLAMVVLILGSERIWVWLPAEVVAASLFLFLLDRFTRGASWFLPLAFPVTLLGGVLLGLTLTIVRVLKLATLTTIAAGMSTGAVFVVGLELLLNRYLADRWFVSWSAIAFACTLPLVLFLFYLRIRFKTRQAEIRKLLHR